MIQSVTVGVICPDSLDLAYDAMCLQRCLDALAPFSDTIDMRILVLRTDALEQLTESMRSHPSHFILLLAADTEPRRGFLPQLLAADVPRDGSTWVTSPQVRGMLIWPPLPEDWGPTASSRLPHQVVMFRGADWPRLAPPAGSAATSLMDAIVDAAEHHEIVDDAEVLSFRPTTLARQVAHRTPRFDIRRCGGAVISAAQADVTVGSSALAAWNALSTCDLHGARAALARWQAGRAKLSLKARDRLPRWMTHCDQHAEGIIHESLLCPAAVDLSRDAVAHGDLAAARQALERHPDAYCAAVAVMALAPEDVRSGISLDIPKVIIQGWFDSDLPEDAQRHVDAWITAHPTWQHRFFDSDAAERWLSDHVGSDLVATFRRAKPVAKSNLFRYAYLAVEGGVWSDVDDRPTRSIDELVADRGLVVLRESIGAVGDNFIAVTPAHPVLVSARDEAFRNERDGYTELQWLANGPGMFTRKFAGWIVRASSRGDSSPGGSTAIPLDYRVVPGTRMIDYIAVHENLEYKAGPLAWDAIARRVPEGALLGGDRPQPKSVRQQALLDGGGKLP